jgi:hypothetical protein
MLLGFRYSPHSAAKLPRGQPPAKKEAGDPRDPWWWVSARGAVKKKMFVKKVVTYFILFLFLFLFFIDLF